MIVRRLRGVGAGKIELNPAYPWRFRVQGPTWNTTLDLAGIDVREVRLDGGAARVECFLPRPRGVVGVKVSGGVVGVRLHRPPGVRVVAKVSSGALRVRLDAFELAAAVMDARWDSGPPAGEDRYELEVSGGAVQVTLDEAVSSTPAPTATDAVEVDPEDAIRVLLEGIAATREPRTV